jgi:general secretion pathway protein D
VTISGSRWGRGGVADWRRTARATAIGAVVLALGACATGRAVRSGDAAAKRGDWDTAVAYYRDALGRDPSRIDVKMALQEAQSAAAALHLKRARDLEAQDQLSGAAAEYRLVADLDSANALALSKAAEIERKIRDAIEASRPKPQIDQLRQQAAQTSTIPHLDPRIRVPRFSYNGSVKELLKVIGSQTGITVQFDSQVQETSYSITVDDSSLEEVLNQVLTANSLTYKVLNSKTIFIYKDEQLSRQKYDDQYAQVFYISNADPTDVNTLLQALTTGGTNAGTRPTITLLKGENAIFVRATEPVMRVIAGLIAATDKPKAEVLVDVEILEVDRTRVRQLGLDLSQYALGFTFSPETAPPTTSTSTGFPTPATPFNLNTISQGVATNNFYVTAPSALIRLLEQDNKTRILAKPELRGREGSVLTLNLGQSVPVAQTQFQAAGTGGIANIPATQITYRDVGVNLSMTPQVTYQDEIILQTLTVENSSIGPDITVGGQATTSFIDRKAAVTMRLRDGESNLLAGLMSDTDTRNYSSLPGLSNIPILRSIFGNGNVSRTQTDIVMIVTPHILRSHELTAADLKPMYIGTGQNLGGSTPPALISPDIPIQQTAVVAPGVPLASAGTSTTPPSAGASAPPPSGTNPRVVPIEAVPSAPAPQPPSGSAQVIVSVPTAAMQVGGPAYTVPVTITGVQQVGTVTLTLTYNPAVLRAEAVNQGTFMQQGGVVTTFAPKIDAAAGRIDIPISRPAGANGASGTGLLAGIAFQAVGAGSSTLAVSGVVLTADGKPITVQMVPANVTVR